jgi:hypothetical protein
MSIPVSPELIRHRHDDFATGSRCLSKSGAGVRTARSTTGSALQRSAATRTPESRR